MSPVASTSASVSPTAPLVHGPVMLDVADLELSAAEHARLQHPLVGGVILFARNFRDSAQLRTLTAAIHAARTEPLVIAVDHEGGRVQRFRSDGFTPLPPLRALGAVWERDPAQAHVLARAAGRLLAGELRAHGVDLSFAPVLDLDYGVSRVIGDRALHRDPHVVETLALALESGMAEAGMGCVGKHFPGHGFIEADSHVEIPVDPRDFDTVWRDDLVPYRGELLARLAGVMPAHVRYPAIDAAPAGFSPFWLQEVLRERLGFAGVVFSDDLTMEGATVVGDIVARADAALRAGCDMVLVCNRPDLADELLARWQPEVVPESRQRIARLRQPDASPLAAETLASARATLAAANLA